MSKAAVDAHNYLTASGDGAIRLRRNGGAVGLPAHAEDLPEPTLREMFLENRQWKNDLRRRAKKGEPVGDQLSLARRRAKWIKHMLRESYPNANSTPPAACSAEPASDNTGQDSSESRNGGDR